MKDPKQGRRGKTPMNRTEWGPVYNDATLGRDIQGKIGEQLRSYYDDVVSQGVPDRFADLLKRLDERSGGDRS
jgi:hypothetical protein